MTKLDIKENIEINEETIEIVKINEEKFIPTVTIHTIKLLEGIVYENKSHFVDGYIIYGLFNSHTKELRYVGLTKDMQYRYDLHFSPEKLMPATHKNSWIKSLLNKNIKIEMLPLEKYETIIELKEAEVKAIAYYRSIGARLTNMTLGGDGGWLGTKHTDEWKRYMSSIMKGRKNPKISELLKGRPKPPCTQEHRDNMSKAKKGQPSPRKGVTLSDETKEKLSKALSGENNPNFGIPLSEEHKEKISQSHFGIRPDEETRLKMSLAKRKWTDEQELEIYNIFLESLKQDIKVNIIHKTLAEKYNCKEDSINWVIKKMKEKNGYITLKFNIEEYIGKKFGKLTIIKYTGYRNDKHYYEVKCDCDNIIEVILSNLRSGNTVKCGKGSCVEKNIYVEIGKKYNKLTIIKFSHKDNGSDFFKTICDCGNERIVQASKISIGTVISCGLDRCASTYHPMQSSALYLYSRYQSGNLSFKDFVCLSQMNCIFCNAEPNNKFNRYGSEEYKDYLRNNGTFLCNNLSRFNKKLPHDTYNCLPTCLSCNKSLKKLTDMNENQVKDIIIKYLERSDEIYKNLEFIELTEKTQSALDKMVIKL